MERHGTLIIGAGLAGIRTASTLRSLGYTDPITLLGDEPHLPYERPALSKDLLTGTREQSQLTLMNAETLQRQRLTLQRGIRVVAIDPEGTARTDAGTDLQWEHLVFATGARARELPGTGHLSNVCSLRTIDDALRLKSLLTPGARLVIVGCGFVGAEVASTAVNIGMDVTVLETAAIPFEQVLGQEVGRVLVDHYRAAGVKVVTGARVQRVVSQNERATAVEVEHGVRIDADVVLVGIGAIPNDELFHAAAETQAGRGIPVAHTGQTVLPGVYACGDVAAQHSEHGHVRRTEHWTSAAATAITVARSIVGAPAPAAAPPYVWSDQFGMRLQIVGHAGNAVHTEIVDSRPERLLVRYRNEHGQLLAGLASNRPTDVAQWRQELIAA